MSTLNQYSGEWNFEKAAFLLGRTTFGKSLPQVESAVQDGLDETLNKLFHIPESLNPPIHYKFENEPGAPLGTTWVDNYYTKNDIPGLQNARNRSLTSWAVGNMLEPEISIKGKMALFWHEHFALNNINRPEFGYHYLNLIFENVLGDFRHLVKEMTVSAAMLRFLNGDENTKQSPNENYARELLELFTIGRGFAVAPGDYTNYTEGDILAIARALTGWRIYIEEGTGHAKSRFVTSRHDIDTKQLSHRFDNIIIQNANDTEYLNVIDIILAKEETAKHICRQLHIWFVGSDINDEVETNIIAPLAKIMFDDDYNIANALRTLIGSEYFLDGSHLGCMLLSPFDFLFKILKTANVTLPENLIEKYYVWENIHSSCVRQEMELMEVPSVAGWKSYYQSPGFYQYWINSVSLGHRDELINNLINGVAIRGRKIEIDVLKLAATIDNSTNPNHLISGISSTFFELPLSENQIIYLKEILIPGLPDFEWTIEYGALLAEPDNIEIMNSVRSKLKSLVRSMMKMPEFQLM